MHETKIMAKTSNTTFTFKELYPKGHKITLFCPIHLDKLMTKNPGKNMKNN